MKGKAVPESTYRNHVLRARSSRNHFTFCRDWVWVMTKMEALFLQDLVNRASNPKAPKQTITDEEGEEREYVLLSNKYLQRPPMAWDDRACTKHLSSLEQKGFVRIARKGWKTKRFCRWVHIDVLKIETVLDEVAKDTQGGGPLSDPSLGMLASPGRGIYNGQRSPGRGSKERSESSNVQSEKSSKSTGFASSTSSPGFFPERDKKIGRPEDKDRALRLWNKLLEKRLLDKKSKFSDWIKEFRDLRDKDGVDDQEIEEILKDYLPRISLEMSAKENGCLPQAFSARTFRAKFLNIRARLACLKKDLVEESEEEKELRLKAEKDPKFGVDKKGNIREKLDNGELGKMISREREENDGDLYGYTREYSRLIKAKQEAKK